MTLEVLQKEMIMAMKAGNKIRKDAISSLIGAIKKVAIDEKCKDNITEELVNRVILKEKKTMQEMIDTCPAGRFDTFAEYTSKMQVIDEFAPKLLSAEEVHKIVTAIIAAKEITTLNKSTVMKAVMPELKGKADGKVINEVVSELTSKKGK